MFRFLKFLIKFIGFAILLILTIVTIERLLIERNTVEDDYDRFLKESDALIITYHDNGIIKSKMPLKKGVKDGTAYSFYTDGSKRSEVKYKQDKLNGVQKSWHKNGNLKGEEVIVNNVRDGVSKDYYESGIISREVVFKDGDMVSFIEYNKNGEVEYSSKVK